MPRSVLALLVGPGRCVCRWAAARPRDRHTRAALGVVDLEARPGPAATHGRCSQALRSLRLPPHQWRCVAACGWVRRLEARPGPAATHWHRGQAPLPPTGPAAHGCRSQALLRPLDPPAPFTPAVQPEFAIELVACGSAGVPGAVGPGRPRDRHTRAALGVVDLEARPCPPDPPAPSTPVVPGCCVWFGALTRCPARLRHSPRALEISRVKPVSPLLAQA